MRADAAQTPVETPDLVGLADRCVQCGLCLPHCPTYRLDGIESESPRGRIAYVKAVATGLIAATETGDRHLDHCLGCRRCEEVCPAGVEMERLLVGARAAQVRQRPLSLMDRWRLSVLARPGLLKVLLGLYRLTFDILPLSWRPLPVPGRGSRRSYRALAGRDATVAVFVGCVAGAYETGTRAALVKLLQATGTTVVTPAGQGCCGTAAAHAGDTGSAIRLEQANRQAFAGHAKVLSLASGCQSLLAASLNGVADVEDALVFLDREAGGLQFRPARARVALHLPCSQRVLGGAGALRRLLARVPDLDLVELPDTGCCGAAGLHQLAEPDRAARLRAPLLDVLAVTGTVELLSANIGCRLHLGNGANIPVRHPIEFLAEHLT